MQHTIKTIYPKYYPAEVVDFFCEHHSMEAIAKDVENGYVSVLKIDGNIVATGCFIPNMDSENGEVSDQAVFSYHQNGSLLWAEYSGGDILKGSLIGYVLDNGESLLAGKSIVMWGRNLRENIVRIRSNTVFRMGGL